jgi:membrane protease subunit HflC
MKRRALVAAVAALIVALFVLFQVLVVARTGQVVVITTLGRTDRAITEPGAYLKWPWPIQKKHVYDHRIHVLEGSFEQTLMKDGQSPLIMLYAGWRIGDPTRFFVQVETQTAAEQKLDGLLRSHKNRAFGQRPFSHLVCLGRDATAIEQLEQDILAGVRSDARELYGIDVAFVGVRKIGLPERSTEEVFKRMREERHNLATDLLRDGEKQAAVIRADADKQREIALSKARAKAKRIMAEGDAAAAKHYAAFEQNTELAMFLKQLEVLEETLKQKTTIILDTKHAPFNLLRADAPMPAKQTAAPTP